MSGDSSPRELATRKLHQLNADVQADPGHKLQYIQKLYQSEIDQGDSLADIVLIVDSIVKAGGEHPEDAMNQTNHLRAATPIYLIGMFFGMLLGFAALILGGFAIYKNSLSPTEVHLPGFSISTGSVGTVIAVVGLVTVVGLIRKAFKHAAYSRRTP